MAVQETGTSRRLTWIRLVSVAAVLLLAAEVQFVGRNGPGMCVSAARERSRGREKKEAMVSTCEELQDALRDGKVIKVVVNGSIKCTRDDWPQPINLRRNVEVAGNPASLERFKSSNATFETAELLSLSIDWTDLKKAVVVERGSLVYFHDLVMFQADGGVGAVDIPFFRTRKGATGVFAGIVLVIDSCSLSVDNLAAAVSQVPRPEFIAGVQSLTVLGPDSLLMRDIAIWWPNSNSLWQICSTAVECNLTERTDPLIGERFGNEFVEPSCKNAQNPKGNNDDEATGE